MSAAHTPGPWHVAHPRSRRSLPHIRNFEGIYVMDAPPRREGVHGTVRQAADARLIAAAPELLEAAQAAWNCIAELSPTQARVETAQMLQAAIDKATGSTT